MLKYYIKIIIIVSEYIFLFQGNSLVAKHSIISLLLSKFIFLNLNPFDSYYIIRVNIII